MTAAPNITTHWSAYPAWICADCGDRYGKRACGIATWHEDVCGICGRTVAVTEARDYGGLRDDWRNP